MAIKHISIRSYSKRLSSHFHDYHQLVLPLHGSIEIIVGNYSGYINPGDCVIIKAGQIHSFSANENARFIVVDSDDLPLNILNSVNEKVAINASLTAYIQFIEIQLMSQINEQLDPSVIELFHQLLAQQPLIGRPNKIDKRIEKIVSSIAADISQPFDIDTLAKQACLSNTQFKKLFKANLGSSCQQYITQLRMEKAKALLTHTDTPINIIAEQCGYINPSAFSRRFKTYFGQSPRSFII